MGGKKLANTFRCVVTASLALALLAPAQAHAAESVSVPPVDSVLGPIVDVPGVTLPGVPGAPGSGQLLSVAPPGVSNAVPMAHIKARVAKRVFRGTVLSIDPARGRLVVTLGRGPHPARNWRRAQIGFLVGSARLRVGDWDGDGDRDLNDVKPGHRVMLKALVGRGPVAGGELSEARLLVDKGPARSKRVSRVRASRRGRRIGK
jgi:hypothetical protein